MKAPKMTAPGAVPFGESCVIVDVRTGVEHTAAALKQPHFHIPLQELDVPGFLKQNGIDGARPVYVLCRSGKRAGMAADAFIAAGHDNVHVIEGGIVACEAAGIALKKGEVISLERQVRIAAGLLVVTGVALGALVSPMFYTISGFVGAGLVFAGVTDWCGLAFLMARAPWNKRPDQSAPAAACSSRSACATSAVTETKPDVVMPEGTTFYSPANGKPAAVEIHALTKTGAPVGGCS
ncbi:MAG: rhodanese-like domain-containing protein [bacterium]|nr:rhodanese-like domain-containing protein [bacterium]